MQEDIIGQPKPIKLYTTGWIVFATYIGGPLAATYLMSKNFEYLNHKEHAQSTIKIGIIATLIIFGILPFIPASFLDRMPNSIIPLVYCGIVYGFMVQYQEKDIAAHIKNKGATQSGWKTTGIAIIALLISIAFYFGLVLLLPPEMITS